MRQLLKLAGCRRELPPNPSDLSPLRTWLTTLLHSLSLLFTLSKTINSPKSPPKPIAFFPFLSINQILKTHNNIQIPLSLSLSLSLALVSSFASRFVAIVFSPHLTWACVRVFNALAASRRWMMLRRDWRFKCHWTTTAFCGQNQMLGSRAWRWRYNLSSLFFCHHHFLLLDFSYLLGGNLNSVAFVNYSSIFCAFSVQTLQTHYLSLSFALCFGYLIVDAFFCIVLYVLLFILSFAY